MEGSDKRPYIVRLFRGMYRQRGGRWAIYGIGFFVFIALTADFLANNKPLLCSYENNWYSPVLNEYAIGLGWSQRSEPFRDKSYHEMEYQWSIWPAVRFTPGDLQLERGQALSPMTRSDHGVHWLGTDGLGRDVMSGLIHGTRTALAIAILSMGIAFLIGVLLGIGAGYLGDSGWYLRMDVLIVSILGFLGLSYTVTWTEDGFIMIGFMIILFLGLYAWIRDRWVKAGTRRLAMPVDGSVLRIMEILRAIPDLFLLLAVLAILQNPGLIQIALLIGLLRWPSIARYVRAEVLKIRGAPFIEVARMQGHKTWRIMWTYLLPNAIGPAMIAVVFGMSSAILIEAALSFLGIGLPASEVSWGSMMSEARGNLAAWWLAFFPGLGIFLLIWMLNQAADALLGELQTERKHQSPYF